MSPSRLAPPVARNIYPNALAVRQLDTSDLPSQCQSTCQVMNTITNCGSSLSCICVSSLGTQLQTCMNCLIAAEPSVSTDANSAMDAWDEACGASLTLNSGSTSTSASGSTATSSGSIPVTGGTGNALGMKAATGIFGLVVVVACGFIIL
ncbi:hypothetical protein EDB19DRAFT_1697536 [Suillus lakei]|nr:hypothetical protein EDB19DRAFT_1697536 [Suillus lakei]